jgi:hypothetical protein
MKNFISALLIVFAVQPLLAAEGTEQSAQPRSYKVAKGGTLEVSIALGDIRVLPWDKDEVSVRVKGLDEEYLDELRITHDENTVSIRYYPDYYEGGEGRFEVNVPARFNLDLETNAGEIDVTGKLTGKLHARSSGGELRIDDVDGSVEMWTSGGDILTGDISGPVTLQTAGGNVTVGALGAESDITTSGGEISISRVARGLVAHTAGGNVMVGDIGGKADILTSGGDVTLGRVAGSARLKTAGGNIELESAGGSVSAQTSGGDIRLDSVAGDVDARTAAGNIILMMIPSGKDRSRLSTSVGDIRLYLPANARATIDARVRIRGGRWSDGEGSIESDFDATKFERNRSERELRATYSVNGGGPAVSIDVGMGNIDIRKADEFTKVPKSRRKQRQD